MSGNQVQRRFVLWRSGLAHFWGLRLWWRHAVVEGVDQQAVIVKIAEESGWSPRYAFMILMSAGIAVLGLLLSSPAVVIGAMLISPLMNPILGFGFSLATYDFRETRRSLTALVLGSAIAIAFTGLIVLLSPLKETTAEILSRTRPNLFDLLVALFAALAGTFAIIKGQGGTIVGVAIATALMPPLAVVGYGLATWNMPILGGALALFVTNFVTIALSATIMARLYGFGHSLSGHQNWLQSAALAIVFVVLAVPLAVSLSRIAREAVTVNDVRAFLANEFGARSRVTQLSVDFDTRPIAVRSVVIAPRTMSKTHDVLEAALKKKLGRPLTLQVDQVLLASANISLDAQHSQLLASKDAATAAKAEADSVRRAVGLAAGVSADKVILDPDDKRITATAVSLPGGSLETYHALEQRAQTAAPAWRITVIPPLQSLPLIRFASGSDKIDDAARQAILASAWAAQRWNASAIVVPGLPAAGAAPKRPLLSQRRALAIAAILQAQEVQALPARANGPTVRLSIASGSGAP
jgi:uncharacterized hydrophobic protein (TIGR00271 family)